MGDGPVPEGGRRSYDPSELVEERMMNLFREEVAETRHLLRNEFTAAMVGLTNKLSTVEDKVDAAALLSTREHAQVTAHLSQLTQTLADTVIKLEAIAVRTTALEKIASVDHAKALTKDEMVVQRKSDRRWLVGTAVAVVSAMAGIVALMPH